MFALHEAHLDAIPKIQYGPLNLSGISPKCRVCGTKIQQQELLDKIVLFGSTVEKNLKQKTV